MSKQREDLDQLIREAMNEEEREFYDSLGEPSLPQMVTEVFRGRMRWLNRAAVLIAIGFMALGLWSVQRLVVVESSKELVWWATALFFSLGGIFAMKIWYWLELNRLAVTREIKRLEAQVLSLRRFLERTDE